MVRRAIGQVGQLWRYPVKSLAGEPIWQTAVDRTGLSGDRSWALKDVLADEIANCKVIPALLGCAARYPETPRPGLNPVHPLIELPDGRTLRTDDPFIEAALSAIAGRPLTLWPLQPAANAEHYCLRRPMTLAVMRHRMGLPPDAPLPDFSVYDPDMMAELQQYATPRGSYKDAYPVHFITSGSVQTLQGLAPGLDINARRFRPNLVIEGEFAAGFPEHEWAGHDLIIGEVVLQCGPRTVRCAMPGQAQHGVRAESRIGAVLRRHTGYNMGAYASVREGGTIAIGDAVYLAARRRRHPARVTAAPEPPVASASAPIASAPTEARSSERGDFSRLRVTRKEFVAQDVVSLGLKAERAAPPGFVPGQHLTFRLQRPGDPAPLLRSYSISCAPQGVAGEDYAITVKRIGAASVFLHDDIRVGDELEARWPAGRFFVLPSSSTPLALISNGIGITPLFSMLQSVAACTPDRQVVWLHATKSGRTHVFRRELAALAARLRNLASFTVYRQPEGGDIPGQDYQSTQYITLDDLAPVARLRGAEIFLCGTTAFMASVKTLLQRLGIDAGRIRTESFGTTRTRPARLADAASAAVAERKVRFARAGVEATWTTGQGSLLELAEEFGIRADYGCRYGTCCACSVPLLEGEVVYPSDGIEAQRGAVLLCCAEPASDLVVDL
ncbi:MAG: Flavohemoprotein [Steroidobacteraceae bacterium]|nr:Flavohemoprotein [Steroidobacteraceae bacterium]